jgi:hypothetical protein
MPGPVLFCYDGSEGSRAAMAAAAELVAYPAPAVVCAHAARPVLIAPER